MSLREFTVNLVSNASMATFPDNTLAHFTSLLPQQLSLTRFWVVALAEIAWPAAIQNITSGHFKYRDAPEARKDNDIAKTAAQTLEKESGMVGHTECLQCVNYQYVLFKRLSLKKSEASNQVSI